MDLFGKKKIKELQEKLNESIQSTLELEKTIKILTCINELLLADNEHLKAENKDINDLNSYLQDRLNEILNTKKPEKEKKIKKSKKSKK